MRAGRRSSSSTHAPAPGSAKTSGSTSSSVRRATATATCCRTWGTAGATRWWGVRGRRRARAEGVRRHGTLSWAEALQPGIDAARAGMLVTGNFRNYLITDYGPDVAPSEERIRWTRESRRIYTKEGRLYSLGEVIANPDLARTYERLAEVGPEDFYKGEIAATIAADF